MLAFMMGNYRWPMDSHHIGTASAYQGIKKSNFVIEEKALTMSSVK